MSEWNKAALEGIRRLASEGRVSEGGKPLAADLVAPAILGDVDEKQFQQAVRDLAERNGWLCYHTYDSRKCTPGFPDLVLVRERVLWVELKVRPNKPTAEQLQWIDALKAAHQSAYVFYPEHWPIIVNFLEGVS